MSQTAPAGWQLPPAEESGKAAVVRTGPSGLVLGRSARGAQVAIRLFRPQGTRILLDLPAYATWLVAFRAMCLGAHLSVISEDHRGWRGLAKVVGEAGGTIDLLRRAENLPAQGRPYRPSLVIDDAESFDGIQAPMGAWQAMATITSTSSSSAVHALRNCDLALIGQTSGKSVDHLRRAYLLSPQHTALFDDLGSAVVLAMPRRAVRVEFPPTQTEYELLFA
ncbi:MULTISPECIES: hypothetical protein [Aestuariimicrobium]|uniref:hypothetical protein n=1 Tax=Aestuariimicrobium TaxID=396388 RepID=UPI0003B579CE|nr:MULTISPECIES: hypothetical protein [Aestuariimicrobium]CAI9402549.1 hypothetical protein AESSP_00823 [Aestuariimicrobium sp. T2.26MG-19.2B]